MKHPADPLLPASRTQALKGLLYEEDLRRIVDYERPFWKKHLYKLVALTVAACASAYVIVSSRAKSSKAETDSGKE